jgi:hypothetical protein
VSSERAKDQTKDGRKGRRNQARAYSLAARA